MLLGGSLTLLIGPGIPVPAPPILLENLESVTVTHSDSGRSGFQLSFAVGRNRTTGLLDYPPLVLQLVRASSRVVLVVTLNGRLDVIMDGIITNHQLAPAAQPGGSKLTVTGEDISVMMDLEEKSTNHRQLPDHIIARTILGRYAAYGLLQDVRPSSGDTPPLTGDSIKNGTDLGVLNEMAQRWGHVFYIESGPLPTMNKAYWGPPERTGLPQRALTFNMGASSNLNSISLQADATKPKLVLGTVRASLGGVEADLPVLGFPIDPPMAAIPAWIYNAPFVGTKPPGSDHQGDWGRAMASATGEASRASRDALTASGELDVGRYGEVLKARRPVDLRGVGLSFDGTWYVKSVTHTIARGSYKQSFSLEREGFMPLSPVVRA